jgi:hypothetical protein
MLRPKSPDASSFPRSRANAGIQGFEGDPLPPVPYQGKHGPPAFVGVTSAALALSMPFLVGV